MALQAQEKRLTLEEFQAQYLGKPYELVYGKVIEMSPAGGAHGYSGALLSAHVGMFIIENDLGAIFAAETGFILADDLIRGADFAYIRKERWQAVDDQTGFVPITPDLAIEIISPSNTAAEMHEKIDHYLSAGTQQVWILYPSQREIVVHTPDRTSRTFGPDDIISGGQVLPGFSVQVAALFPPLK